MNLEKRRIIEQIVQQANDAYAELEKSKKTVKDWKDFGLKIRGIYRSYYKANDLYSEAMQDILSGKRRNLNPEIIDGNYGLRAVALSEKDTVTIKEDKMKSETRMRIRNSGYNDKSIKFLMDKEKIIIEILNQANRAHLELQKSEKTKEDWQTFGRAIEGIYRSYAYLDKEVYSAAMLDIVSGKVKDIHPEILDGNYGLRTVALSQKETKQTLEIARDIAKKHGKQHAKRYVKGVPTCLAWACNELEERKKQVKENFKYVIDVVVKQTY